MSRNRAFALLASIVAMFAMMVGVVVLTPGSASATPPGTASGHYPPPPPSMVVNKGTVKVGVTVRASGRDYTKYEKVYVTVTLIPKGSTRPRVVKVTVVRADSKGRIALNVRMAAAGTVTIKGKGTKSGKTASAAVHVIAKYKGHGWWIQPAALSTGATGGGSTVLVSADDPAPAGVAGVALATLAVMGLAGSALITRQVVRRRRGAAATA